jgi:hypothetical protein
LLAVGATLGSLLLAPSPATAAGIIGSLSVAPSTVRDGETADTTVLVFSSDPGVASVPASFVIPAGSSAGTFPVATNAAAPPTIVQITAWVGQRVRQRRDAAWTVIDVGVVHSVVDRRRAERHRHGPLHRCDDAGRSRSAQ